MLLRAINEFSIERDYSVLIGDKISDIQAANRASIESILFKGENLKIQLQSGVGSAGIIDICRLIKREPASFFAL